MADSLHTESPSPRIDHDASTLSIFPCLQGSAEASKSLGWYHWWIHQQIASLPRPYHTVLVDDAQVPEAAALNLTKVFVEVARSVKAQQDPCLDCIVEDLISAKIFKDDLNEQDIVVSRTLVFAMLGWQTMLYQPSFGTSPSEQFAILNDLDGFHGQAFLAFKQDTKNSKRRLDEFLMGFGLLVPPKNSCFSEDAEEKSAFDSLTTVDSGELNAYMLNSIAHASIKWVDCLSVHL